MEEEQTFLNSNPVGFFFTKKLLEFITVPTKKREGKISLLICKDFFYFGCTSQFFLFFFLGVVIKKQEFLRTKQKYSSPDSVGILR